MKPLTAFSFIFMGVALALLTSDSTHAERWARIVVFPALLIGGLTAIEYAFHIDLPLDSLVFSRVLARNQTTHPGQMALSTAITFILLGTAVIVTDARRFAFLGRVREFSALGALLISLIATLGYLYNVQSLYGVSAFASMAAHTAMLFCLLAVAVLSARPNVGITAVITSNRLGGLTARRLLPIAILMPIAFGYLRLQGQRAGWYDTNFGVAILVAATVIALVAMLTVNARWLNRVDELRAGVEEHDRQLAAIVSSSDDAIIGKSLDGVITSWNLGAQRMYGYAEHEVLGKSISMLLPQDRQDELSDILLRIGRGEHTDHYETKRVHKDGTIIDVSLSVSPVRNTKGDIIAASAIARNITENKLLEEQFRQAQKMEVLGRLAGGVAHDFNNLLGIILGYSDLLQANDEKSLKYIAQIKAAGQRAVGVTRQLLLFSRQEVFSPRVLNLNAIVNNVSKMLMRLIGEDISLTFTPAAQLDSVRADLGQVEQLLMNLVINARDAMPQGGRIHIETENAELDEAYAKHHPGIKPGRFVMLAVSDTGCGIDEKTRSRIFEPFFTTKPIGQGTGLGLSTVQSIVDQSKGHIWVYSEVGTGTTFKIYLPRVGETAGSLELPKEELPLETGSETILLVEDDLALRLLIAGLLEDGGYTVLDAGDAKAAITLASQYEGKIDLLLTDMIMPEMNGRQLATVLRQRITGLKELYMSGYAANLISPEELNQQVSLLQKPFTQRALLRYVRSALDANNQ